MRHPISTDQGYVEVESVYAECLFSGIDVGIGIEVSVEVGIEYLRFSADRGLLSVQLRCVILFQY
jgi:hypothetical protein